MAFHGLLNSIKNSFWFRINFKKRYWREGGGGLI